MELFKKTLDFIEANLIFCLIPIILTLAISSLFFKKRLQSKKAIRVVSWSMIIYTSLSLIYFFIDGKSIAITHDFFNRRYFMSNINYLIIFLLAMVFPFSLLIKRFQTKFWFVMIVAFLMKIGVYFERFVIILTSKHRDFDVSNSMESVDYIWKYYLLIICFQGFTIALVLLGLQKLYENFKFKTINPDKN